MTTRTRLSPPALSIRPLPLFLAFILLTFLSAGITACEDEDDDDDEHETLISEYGDDDSHRAGQDCMQCHVAGGDGEGRFTVAGTVYDSLQANIYPNATIYLYTGPAGTGTLAYTCEVDAEGNFYTTESIDFGTGLYVSARGALAERHMVTPVTSGACNGCHGVSTGRIWTK